MSPSAVVDAWEQGDPYERYVGRWSRRVAPLFLAWMNVPVGRRWVDVGCGTGALCAAILTLLASSVAGVEPSEAFWTAHEIIWRQGRLAPGTATQIPLEGKIRPMWPFPDLFSTSSRIQRAALAEMARAREPAARSERYVWDYAGKMELMRFFWDAAVELDPGAMNLDEGVRFPQCHPDAMIALFRSAGLTEIAVTAIDIPTHFASFDDYWQPFLGGQGPAPSYAMSLDEEARARLRDCLRERIPALADGSIALTARAWAIRATA
jgi:SAM-dependent methyltransferase